MLSMVEDTLLETVLETGVRETPPAAGEAELLLYTLDRTRAQFARRLGDLAPDAAGGLLRRLARAENRHTTSLTGRPLGARWGVGFDADDSPERLYDLWTGAVRRSRAAWAALLAGGVPGRPADLRRVLLDLRDEYARHGEEERP